MSYHRWGILGPGRIARKFAAALPLAEGELWGVASRDVARGSSFGAEFGASRVYDSYEGLLADAHVDVVYIAAPHAFHEPLALLCLSAGKAVLCEKPMALSASQVSAMAAEASSTFLMEAMWTRFLPMIDSVISLVRSGEIGSVQYVRGDFGYFSPYVPTHRLFDLSLGGGSLLDIGVYPLFLCLYLLGRPSSVVASGRLAPSGADEYCHAVLSFEGGASGVITSELTCNTSCSFEICGSLGRIEIPTYWYKGHRYTLYRTSGESSLVEFPPVVNGFEYQIREVHRCLDAGLLESPHMPVSFSLMMSQVMDEIRGQVGVRYPGE